MPLSQKNLPLSLSLKNNIIENYSFFMSRLKLNMVLKVLRFLLKQIVCILSLKLLRMITILQLMSAKKGHLKRYMMWRQWVVAEVYRPQRRWKMSRSWCHYIIIFLLLFSFLKTVVFIVGKKNPATQNFLFVFPLKIWLQTTVFMH